MRYYIEKDDESDVLLFTTSEDEPSNYILKMTEDEVYDKYSNHIKYIECCYLDENNKLQIDLVKVLANRLDYLEHMSNSKIKQLRKMLGEASAIGRSDIVEEIVEIIKEIKLFLTADFSSLKSVDDLNNLICPELNIDYEVMYSEKLYGI